MKIQSTLLLVFLLALTVRGAVALRSGISAPLVSDEPEYYMPGRSIANGNGYSLVQQQLVDGVERPTAYRMPLPSMLLALVFKLRGADSVAMARWTSIVMSSLSVPLMLVFARQFIPRGPAILAAVACALYPTWIYTSSAVLSEPYFIPAMLCALILSVKAAESQNHWTAIFAGLAWGATALVRPHGLLMALAIASLLLIHAGWRRPAILLATTLLVLCPWVIRNQTQFGHPILLATEGGETLLGANNPYVLEDPNLHGMWVSPLQIAEYNQLLRPIHNDFERDRLQSATARSFLVDHWTQIPRLAAYKLARWLTPITQTGGFVRIAVLGSYGLLILLLMAGVALRLIAPGPALAQVVACTLVFTALTIVYWGGLTRGRLPLEILWLPWGAHAGWEIAARLMRSLKAVSPTISARSSDPIPQ